MLTIDQHNGSAVAFQGDRTILFRKLPINARVQRAIATVTPFDISKGANSFAERIVFNGSVGDWGATKTVATGNWVEVDFHGRRTLVGVRGLNLGTTTLQVDLGGLFVELNQNGGIKAPAEGTIFSLPSGLSNGAFAPLPGVTAGKFKLSKPKAPAGGAAGPDLTEVTIRSVPTNVNLRFGSMSPFWTRVGELTQPENTTDFSAVLQAFLLTAEVENGFYVVPLVLHSDAVARLSISFEIEFLLEQPVLGGELDEIVLPFDYSPAPNLPEETRAKLKVAVPPGARVAPRGIHGRVRGAFDETRVVFVPLAPASPDDPLPATPVDRLPISPRDRLPITPTQAQAQPVSLPDTVRATAVDLHLSNKEAVRLQLDLREDQDGKPGSASLLPEPVPVDVAGPAVSDRTGADGGGKWISVALPSEVELGGVQSHKRYWLVLQCLQGDADWSAVPAGPDAVALQSTADGGFSWRDAHGSTSTPKRIALFRLRRRPEQFQFPIELQVGAGRNAESVKLDRFQALGRVDFNLDFDEVAQAFNRVLDKAAVQPCPEGEQIANGDFEQWFSLGDTLRDANEIELSANPTAFAASPDGAWAYVGVPSSRQKSGSLRVVDLKCNRETDQEIPLDVDGSPDLLAIAPDGSRAYVTGGSKLQLIDTATHRAIGNSIQLNGIVFALAVNPNGRSICVAVSTSADELPLVVQAFTLSELEQLAFEDPPQMPALTILATDLIQARVSALAFSPDGSRLYLTTIGQTDDGEVRIFDASTLHPIGGAIAIGPKPQGIAIGPDGTVAVAVHGGANLLSSIDAETLLVLPTAAGNAAQPLGVALSPDGTIAYVVDIGPNSVRAVSLKTGAERTVGLGTAPAKAFGLTTQGDLLWVAQLTPPGETVSLTPPRLLGFETKMRVPLEWNRTTDHVALVSLFEPFCTVVRLGEKGATKTTALSQTVAVNSSCPYELAFAGLASGEDAFVEVLWLNRTCGPVRTDRVPIKSVRAPRKMGERRQILLSHRARLSPPEGAEQAEIRILVPEFLQAFMDNISFQATDNAVDNPDLTILGTDHPESWSLVPAAAPGVALFSGTDAFVLRNSGSEETALVQEFSALTGPQWALEFEGRPLRSTAASSQPRIELRWRNAAGMPAAETVCLEMTADGFDTATARGDTPKDAAKAALHLVVPPGTSLAIKNVSLKFSQPVEVPVSIIAQAPGEVTVTDWSITFDEMPPRRPVIPERGFCDPTPLEDAGSTEPGCDCCTSCGGKKTAAESKVMVTPNGRPVRVARCEDCGADVVTFGGELEPGAPLFSVGRASGPRRPIIAVREPLLNAAEARTMPPVARRRLSLTDIAGIGTARAKRLEAIGIGTVEALAVARAEDLVRKVRPMATALALALIQSARQLVASAQKHNKGM